MLKLRKVRIDTYKENVAFMRHDCPLCASQGFSSQTKIELGTDGKKITAVLNVTQESFLQPGEVGLCEYAFDKLGLPEGTPLWIAHPAPLVSFESVKLKLDGHPFTADDFSQIMSDIISDRYSKIELTAFVLACAQNNLERDEIVWLTRAMVNTGAQVNWSEVVEGKLGEAPLIVDKHCIGGIPGNRTTMVVVPIV